MYLFIEKFFQIIILAIASIGISILMTFISKKGTDFSSPVVEPSVEQFTNCTLARSEDAPHHAWIEFDKKYECSGALIDRQYVLTLASCVRKLIKENADKDRVKVFLGSRTIPGGISYGVDKIISHNSYVYETAKDDIAVIKLQKMTPLDGIAIPIELPTKNLRLREGDKLVATGYALLGFVNRGNVKEDQQIFPMRVVSSKTCRKVFTEDWDLSGKFCAVADYGYLPCLGDRGSPATMKYKASPELKKKEYLHGLYRFFDECYEKRAELFIDVSNYIDFIKSAMN